MDLDDEELEETKKLPCNKFKYRVVIPMKGEYKRIKKEDLKKEVEEDERY